MTKNSVDRVIEVDDDKILEAGRIAVETGQLTPLVKEELKYTILSRREADGKGQLEVTFDTPHQYQLTPEERQKVERRKEQNRSAARRFREKQKQRSRSSVKKISSLKSMNTTLKAELERVTKEKEEIQKEYHAHLLHCPLVVLDNIQIRTIVHDG